MRHEPTEPCELGMVTFPACIRAIENGSGGYKLLQMILRLQLQFRSISELVLDQNLNCRRVLELAVWIIMCTPSVP